MMQGSFARWLAALDLRRAVLIVAGVAVIVYANSLLNEFAYDDVSIIQNNPTIQAWDRIPGAMLAPYWPGPAGPELALWRPVTTGLFGVQYLIGSGSPFAFHLTNVVMHAAVSGLLVVVLTRLMALGVAFVAGLVFAVHPVHTEAVANVVGQAEITAALAILVALLLHLRGGPRSGWGRAIAIGAMYAIGFGAKESAVTLPGLVFLVDAARERLGFRELPAYMARRWRAYFVMLVVAVSMLTARATILQGAGAPIGPAGFDLLYEIPRIWTLGEVWTHYVRLWTFPLDLSSDYSPNVIPVSLGWNPANVTGVVIVLAVLFGTWSAWRRSDLEPGSRSARAAAFGILWFLIAISPISNTLFLTGVILAERTLYLPSAGLAAAVGWLFVRMARERPRLAPALLLVLLLAGSVRTWMRNADWRTHNTVFAVMMRDHPHSGRAQWTLGDEFVRQGQISQGLFAYRAAINRIGTHYGLLTHVGRTLVTLERWESADRLLAIASRERPDHPLAYGLRAGIHAELGNPRETERFARAALAAQGSGTDPTRLHVLAWALAARGAWDEAAEVRTRADEQNAIAQFWQRWVYDAWLARRAGDDPAMEAALDSARTHVHTGAGRATLDSVLVHDFGTEPTELPEPVDPPSPPSR